APTITYIKKIDHFKGGRDVEYTVDDVPSTGGSGLTVYTEDDEEDIIAGSSESAPTVVELEERGEILRRAAVLDLRMFPSGTYEAVRDAGTGLRLYHNASEELP
ncbi:hypothetical protein BGZ65_012038, partial [Modicella reniformis]